MTVVYPSTALHLAASAARIEAMIAADVAGDPAQLEGAALLQPRTDADRGVRAVYGAYVARQHIQPLINR
jgi:hypothetical protein